MRILAPAVGAVLAAILESSVLTHLQVGGIRPDLVFAVGVAVARVRIAVRRSMEFLP